MIVAVIMTVIMTARFVVKRGELARCFRNGVLWTHRPYMICPAVQAFHASQSSQADGHFARPCPFDADLFAAVGAAGGGGKQLFWFAHDLLVLATVRWINFRWPRDGGTAPRNG